VGEGRWKSKENGKEIRVNNGVSGIE